MMVIVVINYETKRFLSLRWSISTGTRSHYNISVWLLQPALAHSWIPVNYPGSVQEKVEPAVTNYDYTITVSLTYSHLLQQTEIDWAKLTQQFEICRRAITRFCLPFTINDQLLMRNENISNLLLASAHFHWAVMTVLDLALCQL